MVWNGTKRSKVVQDSKTVKYAWSIENKLTSLEATLVWNFAQWPSDQDTEGSVELEA